MGTRPGSHDRTQKREKYHTVLKASPGAAIFGCDILLDILFIADWKQIEEFMLVRPIAVTNVKTRHVSTLITRLVTKY